MFSSALSRYEHLLLYNLNFNILISLYTSLYAFFVYWQQSYI
jgi:hypothetical protein